MSKEVIRSIVASGISCAVTFVLDVSQEALEQLAVDALAIKRNSRWSKMRESERNAFNGKQRVKASELLMRTQRVMVRPMTDQEIMMAFITKINKLQESDKSNVITMLEKGKTSEEVEEFIKECLASYEAEK